LGYNVVMDNPQPPKQSSTPHPFKALEERFGKEGLQELGLIDMRSAELIDRLFKLTTIAVNMRELGIEGGDKWFNRQAFHIGTLMDEAERAVADFQERRGEI